MLKKILQVFFLPVFLSSILFANENHLSNEHQLELLSNLNYLQYSISVIKDADNRAITDDIYYSIINQLDYSSIKDKDGILLQNYEDFLTYCKNILLKEEEKKFLQEMTKKELNNAWKNAFSSAGSIFVPGQNWKQMAVSLVYTTVANIVSISNQKDKINTKLEKDIFYLNQAQLSDMYDMQTKFFVTAVKLLSDDFNQLLIKENSMNSLIKVAKLPDPKEQITTMEDKSFKGALSTFPPYWYLLGNAYQQLGEYDKAMLAYSIFEKLKINDVIEKDNTYIKVLKNKIQIYLSAENPLLYKDEVLNCINLINKNTITSKIGEQKAYCSKIYFILGELDKAQECTNYILNSKTNNSQYLSDIVNLNFLINCIDTRKDSNSRQLFQNVFKYNFISFGYNPIFEEQIENKGHIINATKNAMGKIWNPISNIAKKGTNYVVNLFNKEDLFDETVKEINEEQENAALNIQKSFYFSIPKNIVAGYNITAFIDNEEREVRYIANRDDNCLYFIDYNPSKINKESDIVLTLHKNNQQIILEYKIQRLKKNILEEMDEALVRLGSDSYSLNPLLAYRFAEYLDYNNFEYQLREKDIESVYDKKFKKIQRANKAAKTVVTNYNIDQQVKQHISERINTDIANLSSILASVSEEFYRQDYSLFSPKYAIYDDNYFIIGLKSLYDTNLNQKIYFDSIGSAIKEVVE